jgi:hypothetical protein
MKAAGDRKSPATGQIPLDKTQAMQETTTDIGCKESAGEMRIGSESGEQGSRSLWDFSPPVQILLDKETRSAVREKHQQTERSLRATKRRFES